MMSSSRTARLLKEGLKLCRDSVLRSTANNKQRSLAVAATLSAAAGICISSASTCYEDEVRGRLQESSGDRLVQQAKKAIHSSYCLMITTTTTTRCEHVSLHEFDAEHPTGYTETERFFQCLDYHRSLLFDYSRRWASEKELEENESNNNSTNTIVWPRNTPAAEEIPALETDIGYCLRSPRYRDNSATCRNMQFRVASYYVMQKDNPEAQMKGFKMLKHLAEHGHADGMCLYAILLNDGRIPGVEANPEEAVVWWRRCVDLHRHITATYELAVAMYTAKGVAENPEMAVKLFRQAAHLGHAGAAYMLGECLLDGVGVERDRANALEWLVTAAELGHHIARNRVLVVLQEDYEKMDAGKVEDEQREEGLKWASEQCDAGLVNIERRHTIGGDSDTNPEVLERRKSKVMESRDEG